MKPVIRALLQAISDEPELRQLPMAKSQNPKMHLPSEAAMARARASVAKALKIPEQDADAKHAAESCDAT